MIHGRFRQDGSGGRAPAMDLEFWYGPPDQWYLWKGSAGVGRVSRGAFAVRDGRIKAWFPPGTLWVPSRLLGLLRIRMRDERGEPAWIGSEPPEPFTSAPQVMTSLELVDGSTIQEPPREICSLLPPQELGVVGSALVQFDDVMPWNNAQSRRVWSVTRQVGLDNSILIYHPLGQFSSLGEARSAAVGAETIYVQQPGKAGGWIREGT